MRTIPKPASAYARFVRQRRPLLLQERPSLSFGEAGSALSAEYSSMTSNERAPFQISEREEITASGYADADLRCVGCFCGGHDPAAAGWLLMSEEGALAWATGAYGNQAFVNGWNESSAVPTTVEALPLMAIHTFLPSRNQRCWLCPSCCCSLVPQLLLQPRSS